MKRIFFMTLFVALTTITYSQTDDKGYEEGKWVLKGVTGLNLSQTAMSNWSAGGENSVAGNAYLNGTLTHKSGDWLWVPPVALLPDFDLRSAFLDLKTNLVIPIPHGLRRPALLHDLPHDPLLLHVRGQPGADPAEDRHQHQTGQDGPVQRLLLCHPFREDQVRAGGVEQYRSQFQLY